MNDFFLLSPKSLTNFFSIEKNIKLFLSTRIYTLLEIKKKPEIEII
jgi:hypothetical protein